MKWPRKTQVISVRLTEEDNKRLEAIAEQEGVPPSTSARRLLLEAIGREEAKLKRIRIREKE